MAPPEPSDRDRPATRWTALALATITLAGVALRLPSLGRSLWLDEAWRADIALAPTWHGFWTAVLGAGGGGIGAPMPPLFALALRAAGAVVGHSAAGMRALPVLASIAAIPLAWVVGRRAAGAAAGLAAALLFAASPTALLHGQELKQYSTDVAVVLALLLAVSAVAARPEAARPWLALALAEILAPGLSYPAALVLPGVALATLAACRTGADRGRWLAVHAASAGAACAWYVLVIGPQRARPLVAAYWASEFPPLDEAPTLGWTGEHLADVLRYASTEPIGLAAPLLVLGLTVAARWLGVAALTSVATLAAAAVARVYPLAGGRTSVFLLPFVYLLLAAAAACVTRLGTRGPPGRALRLVTGAAGLIALLVVGDAVVRGAAAPRAGLVYEETAPLIAILEAERRPGDRVYVYDGAVEAFRFHHPEPDAAVVLGGSHRQNPAGYAAELRPLLVPGQRVWLLFSHVHVPPSGRPERETILADLSPYGRQLAAHEAPGASLHLFEIVRGPGQVRHLKLTPEDLRNPERMKELFGR